MNNKISKSQAIKTLWQRGVLSFKYHSGQKVIEEKYNQVEGKLFVANISRRFGKTYWACTKAIETALNSKTKSIIATAFQVDCESIVTPIMFDILKDCPKNIYPHFNKTKKRFEFRNGSTIEILGLDKNSNKLRGNKLNGLVILDEAGFIQNLSYLYSSIIMPATMYSDAKVIMISTPPVSPEHSFKSFCEKATLENAYVKLTIYDNPMVTPQEILEYKKECLTETDFQREYCAEFVTDANSQIVPEFNYDKHTFKDSQRDEYFQFYRKYICFDLGTIDPTAFIFAYYDWKQQKLIIESEEILIGNEVTLSNINNVLTEKPKALTYDQIFRTISDSNERILINDLNSTHKKDVITVKKDEIFAMNAHLRQMFKDDKILISESCKNLISQLMYGVWNKNKTDFARMNGHHNDFIAAITYLSRSLSEEYSPIPKMYGIKSDDLYIPEQYEVPQKHLELRKLIK